MICRSLLALAAVTVGGTLGFASLSPPAPSAGYLVTSPPASAGNLVTPAQATPCFCHGKWQIPASFCNCGIGFFADNISKADCLPMPHCVQAEKGPCTATLTINWFGNTGCTGLHTFPLFSANCDDTHPQYVTCPIGIGGTASVALRCDPCATAP